MSNILGKQYVTPVLIKLYESDAMMTELSSIVSNYSTLRLLVRDLQDAGYLTSKETFDDKRKIVVSLTAKGKRVAEQLKRAQLVAEGSELPDAGAFRMPHNWREQRFAGLSAMTHLNVLDDHVAIQEIDNSGKTSGVIMVYVKKINSHFELWCEKDESKECRHVDFAWSLPQMRALIEEYIRSGKIKKN